jgi:hypothetical protein
MTTARKEVTEVRATGVLNSEGTLREVVLGVDTHLNVHVTVVVDGLWAGTSASRRYQRPSGATDNSSVGRRVSEL